MKNDRYISISELIDYLIEKRDSSMKYKKKYKKNEKKMRHR